MEITRIIALEAKYWEGDSSIEEEQLFFSLSEDEQKLLTDESRYAIKLKRDMASISLGSDFESEFWANIEDEPISQAKVVPMFTSNFFLKYAAVGIVLVALGFSIGQFLSKDSSPILNEASIVQDDTFITPEEALAETKRALLFASNKLNKGNKHLNELSRLDKSMHTVEANTK